MNAHHLRRRSIALLTIGRGARNTNAVFLTASITTSPSATMTGIGRPPNSVARRNPGRALVADAIDARRTNFGSLYPFQFCNWPLTIPRQCRFEEKQCCLSRGGPHDHPEPPHRKKCPPKDWSWSKEHECCIPHREHHHPHPKCDRDWDWNPSSFCCERRHHK